MFEHASSGDFLKLAGPTGARIKIGTRHDFTINEMVEGTPFVIGFERDGDGDMMVYKDNVAGSAAGGHRCKLIAKAMAQAVNAGPHAGGATIDVIDEKNGIYFGEIATIIGDASFGIAVTLDS